MPLHFVVSAWSLKQLSPVNETVACCSDSHVFPCLVFCGKSSCAHSFGLHRDTVSMLTSFLHEKSA